jgi:hypothetical protein
MRKLGENLSMKYKRTWNQFGREITNSDHDPEWQCVMENPTSEHTVQSETYSIEMDLEDALALKAFNESTGGPPVTITSNRIMVQLISKPTVRRRNARRRPARYYQPTGKKLD